MMGRKTNSILMLLVGTVYGYLAGNEPARLAAGRQLQKLSGMAIDSLNRQGESHVQPSDEADEQPTE